MSVDKRCKQLLNGLGFTGRATYLFYFSFFASYLLIARFLRGGLEAGDLNSDSLGKALDCLHEGASRSYLQR